MFKMSANYNRWQGTFNGCSSLTKLPIFIDLKSGSVTKHLTSVNYGFESTFRLCSSLIDLSEYTFEMVNPYVNGMYDCFSGCHVPSPTNKTSLRLSKFNSYGSYNMQRQI